MPNSEKTDKIAVWRVCAAAVTGAIVGGAIGVLFHDFHGQRAQNPLLHNILEGAIVGATTAVANVGVLKGPSGFQKSALACLFGVAAAVAFEAIVKEDEPLICMASALFNSIISDVFVPGKKPPGGPNGPH